MMRAEDVALDRRVMLIKELPVEWGPTRVYPVGMLGRIIKNDVRMADGELIVAVNYGSVFGDVWTPLESLVPAKEDAELRELSTEDRVWLREAVTYYERATPGKMFDMNGLISRVKSALNYIDALEAK